MSFKGESESEETSVVAEVSNESWLNVYVHWQQLESCMWLSVRLLVGHDFCGTVELEAAAPSW